MEQTLSPIRSHSKAESTFERLVKRALTTYMYEYNLTMKTDRQASMSHMSPAQSNCEDRNTGARDYNTMNDREPSKDLRRHRNENSEPHRATITAQTPSKRARVSDPEHIHSETEDRGPETIHILTDTGTRDRDARRPKQTETVSEPITESETARQRDHIVRGSPRSREEGNAPVAHLHPHPSPRHHKHIRRRRGATHLWTGQRAAPASPTHALFQPQSPHPVLPNP